MVAFSPDGNLLAAAGGDSQDLVRLWELPSRKEIAIPVRHEQQIGVVAISPDGTLGVSLESNGTVKAWSIPDGDCEVDG